MQALDDHWFSPKRLKEQEQRERLSVQAGIFQGEGDFGSYYALRTGKNDSWVCVHGLTGIKASTYASVLARILRKRPIDSILDVGCGAGFITSALAVAFRPRRHALGIDISEDAIEFAAHTFSYPTIFKCVAVTKDTNLGEQFDLVHCREFYPFTRTNEIHIHIDYLHCLLRHVRNGGALVVSLLVTPNSLVPQLPTVLAHFHGDGYKLHMTKHLVPSTCIAQVIRERRIASCLTWLRNRVSGLEPSYFFVIEQPSTCPIPRSV